MNSILPCVIELLNDKYLFFLLQLVLVAFVLFAWALDVFHRIRAGGGGCTATVTRSQASMAKFHGTYAALNGLLIAICLTVEVAKEYRVFWVILDTLLSVYVCLLNQWMRNKLIGAANYLTKVESR